ncbi:hypothetical protein [Evansella cellulosilytica]|nr:hypothetical protein [Evansella cellulosilytica]
MKKKLVAAFIVLNLLFLCSPLQVDVPVSSASLIQPQNDLPEQH